MINIFLAPVSSGELLSNYEKSVEEGIETSQLPQNISKEIKENVTSLWGIRDAKKSTFLKIKQDDVVAFYKEGMIISYGIVQTTFIDLEFAKKLWGTFVKKSSGEIYFWPNIIVFKEVGLCRISFSDFRKFGDYNDKFSVRGLIMLNQKGNQEIIERYGSLDNFFYQFQVLKQMPE